MSQFRCTIHTCYLHHLPYSQCTTRQQWRQQHCVHTTTTHLYDIMRIPYHCNCMTTQMTLVISYLHVVIIKLIGFSLSYYSTYLRDFSSSSCTLEKMWKFQKVWKVAADNHRKWTFCWWTELVLLVFALRGHMGTVRSAQLDIWSCFVERGKPASRSGDWNSSKLYLAAWPAYAYQSWLFSALVNHGTCSLPCPPWIMVLYSYPIYNPYSYYCIIMNGVTEVMQSTIQKEPKPYHTSILTGQGWIVELITGHPNCICCELGMCANVFLQLVTEICALGHTNSWFVSLEEQLAIFLYTCVTDLTIRHVGEHFQRSSDTISQYSINWFVLTIIWSFS